MCMHVYVYACIFAIITSASSFKFDFLNFLLQFCDLPQVLLLSLLKPNNGIFLLNILVCKLLLFSLKVFS